MSLWTIFDAIFGRKLVHHTSEMVDHQLTEMRESAEKIKHETLKARMQTSIAQIAVKDLENLLQKAEKTKEVMGIAKEALELIEKDQKQDDPDTKE